MEILTNEYLIYVNEVLLGTKIMDLKF